MPTRRIEYVDRPFVGAPRRTADSRTVGDLLRQQAELSGQRRLMSGQSAADTWRSLAGAFAAYQQNQDRDRQQAEVMAQRRAEQEAQEQFRRDQMAERAAQVAEAQALREEQRRDTQAAALGESLPPGVITSANADALRGSPMTSGRVQVQDGVPVLMRTPAQIRQAFLDKKAQTDAEALANDRTDDNERMKAAQTETARHNRAMELAANRPKTDSEPLVAIIGPDNNPIYVPRSQAINQRPASNREQGRAVTSGDANRIADLDTSLNDLGVLASTLQETKDATGVTAQVGAALWNPITNLTGWGVDAKKRQGVIDRVKQVIGKALEGGVLRKEDEIKYAKILPTIADDPELAASKLEGLRQALIQRRQTMIDALGDAGYEVDRFNSRIPNNGTTAVPDLSGLPQGRGRKFSEGPFSGQTWAIGPDGKPRRVS